MKKAPLAISIALNVVLVACLLMISSVSKRTAFQTLADATISEVRLQEHILTELSSGDDMRVAAIKEALARNIESGNKAAENWQRAAN